VFLPIGDTPNPRGFFPIVNWLLIGINVAVYVLISMPLSSTAVDPNDPLLFEYLKAIAPSFDAAANARDMLAGMTAYDLFVFKWGYKPGDPHITQLFTSMFLHGGLLHLAGNMLFLWIFGDNVEHRIGRITYLLTYLATGVAATLAFSLFASSSMLPLVGASGAISGVLGLYFLLFKRNRVKVLVVFFPFLFRVMLIPARIVLGFYVLVDNLLPFVLGAESNVAYGAHLGGFVAGLVVAVAGERLAWHWPTRDKYSKLGRKRRTEPGFGAADSAVQSLREAMARGSRPLAIETVSRLHGNDLARLTPDECVVLSEWLQEAGHTVAAATILRGCVSAHPGSSSLARVYLALGLMRMRQGQSAAAYQHLLSVFDFNPPRQVADRAREALASIDVYGQKQK